jgi:AraC-like DNA-binding protein
MITQTMNKSLEPLLEAFSSIQLLLNRDNEAHFIVARPTLLELKQQSLPEHLRTSVKKRQGPRIRVRRSRTSELQQILIARWPQDHLNETSLPSIACVIRGAADLRINDYVLHCQQGDIVFYPVGLAAADGSQSHFEGDPTERHCTLLWIYPGQMNGEGLICYLCHSDERKHSAEKHLWFRNPLLAELLQNINQEEIEFGSPAILFHLFSLILLVLQREAGSNNALTAPYALHLEYVPQSGQDPIQRACAYIDSHLDSNLTIDIVAKHIGYSPAVFTKRFKRETSQTFNEYCTASRLKRAAILLNSTELKVITISHMIGLTDCQFRLLASKHWGCTPGKFRLESKSKSLLKS